MARKPKIPTSASLSVTNQYRKPTSYLGRWGTLVYAAQGLVHNQHSDDKHVREAALNLLKRSLDDVSLEEARKIDKEILEREV